MTDPPQCSRCGAALPPDAPAGACPRCLMALNLASETHLPTGEGGPVTQAAPSPKEDPPPLSEIAALFPHLEILEYLGRGGMGVVFRARQPGLNRVVALKLMAKSKAADPAFAERFSREAQALARLSHPGIVAVHD